jgi:hypothetical protein
MTKPGYTHITLVADRSGSMHRNRDDAEGAVNAFIDSQRDVPGTEATITVVDFDAELGGRPGDEPWYNERFHGNVKDCKPYRLFPRGNTALLDAVGRTITTTGERLAALAENERPEHVIFVVQTDGQENSSRDFTLDMVRKLIDEQTNTFGWEFTFLGMGPGSFDQGRAMGIQNTTQSADSAAAYVASYGVHGQTLANVRTGTAKGMSATNITVDADGNVTPDPDQNSTNP